MGEIKKVLIIITVLIMLFGIAYGVTESEVQDAVNSQGKEVVSGNLFIWFICAVAFLKVSQKVDSFMSSLGINVGKTGGSLLGDMLVASKAFVAGSKAINSGLSAGSMSFNKSSKLGFLTGGLGGMIERKFSSSTANTLTTEGNSGGLFSGIGAKMYNSSIGEKNGFASRVIGSIAGGTIARNGMITGDKAKEAFSAYIPKESVGSFSNNVSVANSMDVNSTEVMADDIFENSNESNNMFSQNILGSEPIYSGIEIGGGRISGFEQNGEETRQFAMYSAEKYGKPEGDFTTVVSNDGVSWYKQYAEPTIERTPLSEKDGRVKYEEHIVNKMPKNPQQLDRM